MNSTIEIRWHGRGGQGTKTASLLLADVAFHTGKYVQGFPEYGPERMGAPITAYNRISDEPITIHSNIDKPDIVVIVDETLIGAVPVRAGLKGRETILINSSRDVETLRRSLNGFSGELFIVDGRRISEETIGANFPNIPMLTAVAKACGLMTDSEFVEFMKESLGRKFSGKTQIIEGNLQAVIQTLEELRS